MIFINTNNKAFPWEIAEQLYEDNKKYFLPLDISFEQLAQGLQGNLWAVNVDNIFSGCIYLEVIDGKWYLSGFSKRKMFKHVPDAINALCGLYAARYRLKEIYSETSHKHAKLALLRAGFLQVDTNLFRKDV